MKTLHQCKLWLLAIVLALAGCAGGAGTAARQSAAPLPGDAQFYSFGVVQDEEYFARHIEHAQRYYGGSPTQRMWWVTGAGRAPATIGGLQVYYPLGVRWQLKDGRQYILEDVDVASIMREYFKTHSILLQHQREGRVRIRGDNSPSLVHEIRDDSVTIKWLLTINKTPLDVRLGPQGIGTKLVFSEEEYPVTTLKGRPTSGIDFDQRWEKRTTSKKGSPMSHISFHRQLSPSPEATR